MLELVKDSITNLGNTIVNGIKNVFELLFVPSDNLFDDVQTLFNEKFGIFSQVVNLVKSLTINESTVKPNFKITLYGTTLHFIDFSLFDEYRDYYHGIILDIHFPLLALLL